MAEQLPKIYEPKSIEAQAIEKWRAGNYFHADASTQSDKGSYTIVIPPPNVTAALHLGHALNNTLQDILMYRLVKSIFLLGIGQPASGKHQITIEGIKFEREIEFVSAPSDLKLAGIKVYCHFKVVAKAEE